MKDNSKKKILWNLEVEWQSNQMAMIVSCRL